MEKQTKHKVTDKIIKEYSINCQLCNQVIKGRSVNQCDINLQHHYYFKHRNGGEK